MATGLRNGSGVVRATAQYLRSGLISAKTVGVACLAAGALYSGVPKLPASPIVAKCEIKSFFGLKNENAAGKAEALFAEDRFDEIYQMLNLHPETDRDPRLLFHLARACHHMALINTSMDRRKTLHDEALLFIGKAVEQVPRLRDRALRSEVLALYGVVLQDRGDRRRDEEQRELHALAREHMEAAYREDDSNFLANFALAEYHYGMAKNRTEAGLKSIMSVSAFFDKSSNNALHQDQESLWRTTTRHAYKALQAKPNDICCINMLAQSKFAIGDIVVAKRYNEMARNLGKVAKTAQEKKAERELKELQEKINTLMEAE